MNQEKLNTITKVCAYCGEEKPLIAFNRKSGGKWGRDAKCRECWSKFRKTDEYRKKQRELNHKNGRCTPLKDSPSCGLYLGSYVAERMIDLIFEDAVKAPMGNRGFDFICPNNHTVDVKSSSTRHLKNLSPFWQFDIKRNKIPNYFLLVAYDNKEDLNPLHIWLVPGEALNTKASLHITNSDIALSKWTEYERPDILEKYREKWPEIKDDITPIEETTTMTPEDDLSRMRSILLEIYNTSKREDGWGIPRYLISSELMDRISIEVAT